jgi:hypothetical protein
LNVVYPDGFEHYFVDEEFVVGREFGLAAFCVVPEPVSYGHFSPIIRVINEKG